MLKRNETQLRPTTTIKPTITVSPLFSRRKVLRKKLLSSTNVTSNGLALSPLSVLISNTDSDLLTQTTFNNTLTATDVQQPVTDPTTLPILVQPSSGFVLADSAVLPSNPIVVSPYPENVAFIASAPTTVTVANSPAGWMTTSVPDTVPAIASPALTSAPVIANQIPEGVALVNTAPVQPPTGFVASPAPTSATAITNPHPERIATIDTSLKTVTGFVNPVPAIAPAIASSILTSPPVIASPNPESVTSITSALTIATFSPVNPTGFFASPVPASITAIGSPILTSAPVIANQFPESVASIATAPVQHSTGFVATNPSAFAVASPKPESVASIATVPPVAATPVQYSTGFFTNPNLPSASPNPESVASIASAPTTATFSVHSPTGYLPSPVSIGTREDSETSTLSIALPDSLNSVNLLSVFNSLGFVNSPDRIGDLCSGVTCGTNAQCLARSFRAVCQCQTGFEGDPYTNCSRSECVGKKKSIEISKFEIYCLFFSKFRLS